MPKKSTTHCVFRNQDLFCLNCGGSHQIVYPISIPDLTETIHKFHSLHAKCKPGGWQEPTCSTDLPVRERIHFWLRYGEQGNSSLTLLSFLLYKELPIPYDYTKTHPIDGSDLYRCIKLCEIIPEIEVNGFNRIKEYSFEWESIVNNWAELKEMTKKELAGEIPGGSVSQKMNALYAEIPKRT